VILVVCNVRDARPIMVQSRVIRNTNVISTYSETIRQRRRRLSRDDILFSIFVHSCCCYLVLLLMSDVWVDWRHTTHLLLVVSPNHMLFFRNVTMVVVIMLEVVSADYNLVGKVWSLTITIIVVYHYFKYLWGCFRFCVYDECVGKGESGVRR
jgi:hypothetical protein